MGQRILIIDGNSDHPTQQNIWSGETPIGLNEAVSKHQEIESAIVSISSNLDLLPSGNIYSDSLNISGSIHSKFLLQSLQSKYQFILIDSPSLQEVPHALNLAAIADGMILVARLGTLDHQNAKRCQELLEIAEVNVVGTVINEAR